MVLCYIVLKPLFEPVLWISIQFWVPVPNLSLIGKEIKKLRRNLIFYETSDKIREPKLVMASYSDNGYDITIFWLFWKVFGLYCIPTTFHCCQTPNGRVNVGGRAFLPPPNIGVSWTPSKERLSYLFLFWIYLSLYISHFPAVLWQHQRLVYRLSSESLKNKSLWKSSQCLGLREQAGPDKARISCTELFFIFAFSHVPITLLISAFLKCWRILIILQPRIWPFL